MKDPFSNIKSGRLMSMQPDSKSRFVFKIWFDYTRTIFNSIKEGDFLGVESFAQDANGTQYSVIRITQKIPYHYALPQDLSGYPGFTEEAAKSVAESWITQENSSDEELTKIYCEAVPTGYAMIHKSEDVTIETDRSIPMVGEEARILAPKMLQRIINQDIDKKTEKTVFPIGAHVGHEDVTILMDPVASMNRHFGVFGFTGAGKSNLLSTFVAYSLTKQKTEPIKVVIYDMNDEFTGLLVDVLDNPSIDSYIIAIDDDVFPRDVNNYYNSESDSLRNSAVDSLLQQLLLPSALMEEKENYRKPLANLLKKRVFRQYVLKPDDYTVGSLLEKLKSIVNPTNPYWAKVHSSFRKLWREKATPTNLQQVIDGFVGQHETIKITSTTDDQKNARDMFVDELKEHISIKDVSSFPGTITTETILNKLNERNQSTLIIILAHSNDRLREFSHDLGQRVYRYRSRNPRDYPQVSLVFDEADEFLPQKQSGEDASFKKSREIVERIARRGRKYRIGVGIATQRIIYLDTNTMAQVQTYFVSRLPRQSDRERISQAFMLSEAEFAQTHSFQVGEWLLASHHGAIGLQNVPIPVRLEDANERVKKYLNSTDI